MVIQEAALAELVERFQVRSLSKADWTHEAHLTVGAWHVHEHGPVRALAILRDRIRRLNECHGTPNSETRGYHETITRAYVCLIADVLAGEGTATGLESVRAVLSSDIVRKDALLDYYSHDRLMSIEARRRWIPPNLRPIMPPHWPRPIMTRRLLLRAPRPDDADSIARLITPAVSRWLASWKASPSIDDVLATIEAALVASESGDALHYVMTQRGDAVVGWIRVERRQPASDGVELGFWVGEAFQRAGFATEAVAAVCRAAFRLLEVRTIEAGARVGNVASQRVLANVGMQPIGQRLVYASARACHEPCFFFELTEE